MSEQHSKEYDSVDLTEDENSSEGSSEVENPFHFVDCSGSLNESLSTVPACPPLNLFEMALTSTLNENMKETAVTKTVSDFPVNSSSRSVQTVLDKKVRQFSSIQIKPPSSQPVPDTQDIPEVDTSQFLKSDSLNSEPVNHMSFPMLPHKSESELLEQTTEITLPKKDTIYSPKQPPGKVVIIKKNNKYYKIIIPHNVMPNINKSMGPVLINIPEVGPLVISNDPQAAKEKFKAQQLSLNLDDMEEKPDSESAIARKLKQEALRDKKFCWTFNSCRKRDLEGFSITDRLGFNKTEARRAKMCEKAINTLLVKFQSRLVCKINEYQKFIDTLPKKNKIKLVQINSIINANRVTKKKKNKVRKLKSPTNLKSKTQKIYLPESNSVNSAANLEDYDSDLLVTKKVVILNSDNKEIKFKRPKREAFVRQKSDWGVSKKHKNFKIRPCYVQISRDKRVERAYIEYCKLRGSNIKQEFDKPSSNSLLPKVSELCHEVKNPVKHFAVPNRLIAKQNLLVEKKNMLLDKIIYSKAKLENEMNAFKPFLIETEHSVGTNRSLEYYCNEFSKNNIIFVVNSKMQFPFHVLQAEGFISAVEIGYIKLVEVGLFGKFAMNGMTFRNSVMHSHRAEHNYSMTKK